LFLFVCLVVGLYVYIREEGNAQRSEFYVMV